MTVDEGSATSYKSCNHSWKSFINLKILNLYFQKFCIIFVLYTLKQEYNKNIKTHGRLSAAKVVMWHVAHKCLIYRNR